MLRTLRRRIKKLFRAPKPEKKQTKAPLAMVPDFRLSGRYAEGFISDTDRR
jgi:hypothetical protein